ncbi:hypothetical protein N657DRAFT_684674 [Parathielavia appendiculata]|uniref:Uncharacterized protein n=1 Tax=Parathielavia appendiculata TaxID=2587402 RepID=A0AAN6TS14_9PEZI|nr:hypothetical protein N657DRAFT_684674 [Parathielavia appendiculata]
MTRLAHATTSFHALATGAINSNLSSWNSIPDFTRADADVTILLLNQSDTRYTSPVYDPWFSANVTYNFTYQSNLIIVADRYLSALLCAGQYRLRNPSANICTRLGVQFATTDRLLVGLGEVNTWGAVSGLGGAEALRAPTPGRRECLSGLPNDQWRAGVEGWFQTSLARLQAAVVEFAVKDRDVPASEEAGDGGERSGQGQWSLGAFSGFARTTGAVREPACEGRRTGVEL